MINNRLSITQWNLKYENCDTFQKLSPNTDNYHILHQQKVTKQINKTGTCMWIQKSNPPRF